MSFKYGSASLAHLAGVTPRLREVFLEGINLVDFTILDGIRTVAEQALNVKNGASQTMESRHLPQPPDNLSNAVDALPYPVDWDALERGWNAVKRVDPQLRILEAVHALGVIKGIAHMKGFEVRQGIDWNMNAQFEDQTFLDIPHTEIPK